LYEEYGWPGLEVAWTIRRDRWGEGLATEGGAAALEFAFDMVGRDQAISIIHPDNAPSIRVAEKLGLTFAEFHDRSGEPRNVYAVSRSTWEARRGPVGWTCRPAVTRPEPDGT
jgi:RimJ/RimL family protein N-acetyltransferase